ncbi:hypothetical protein X975_25291, partial [Stegodyphus mimosarum]
MNSSFRSLNALIKKEIIFVCGNYGILSGKEILFVGNISDYFSINCIRKSRQLLQTVKDFYNHLYIYA